MRLSRTIGVLGAAVALFVAGLTQPVGATRDPIFADGGELAGSTNGISFAPDGTLYVANVFGQTITQIDPDSGEILSRLTAADNVFFPDDVFVDADGTIYWTEIALGNVMKKPVGEPAAPLIGELFRPPGAPPGLNSANPLVLTDEATPRLFAAGCYGGPGATDNAFVEIDPDLDGDGNSEGIRRTLFESADCASNGLSWFDGFLYSPQPFRDLVWKIDPGSGERTAVTTNWPVPIGTAFGSNGELYALAQGVGEVVQIDLADTDTDTNRTVIAEIPVGWADNIAVLTADGEADRVFISSASDSTIAEVLPNGELRIVVPGQFQIPLGVNVIGRTVYVTNSSQIVGFDRWTGEQTSNYRAAFGQGFPFATSSAVWGRNLVLMSAFDGSITLWDPVENVPITSGAPVFPIDGQLFEGNFLVTTASPDGEIYRLDSDLQVVEVVAKVPGATGIAAKRGDVYVADGMNGTIVQIIENGSTLTEPVVVFRDLNSPEGIDIRGNKLFVVEGGSETLTSLHLSSGKRRTIATELGLQGPFIFPYGYFNNVTVSRMDIFVNADRANVIYAF